MTNPVTTIFHRSPIQQEISLQVVEAALSDPLFEWAGEGGLQASSERVTTDIRRELLQLGSIPGQCGNFFGPGGHPLFAVRFVSRCRERLDASGDPGPGHAFGRMGNGSAGRSGLAGGECGGTNRGRRCHCDGVTSH